MHILSMTHQRFIKLLTAIEECGSNTSCHVCFMLLGHFIKHLMCIRGTKSKPTPTCEENGSKWLSVGCWMGIYRGEALVAVGLANRD